MENSFSSLLDSASSILILLPSKPYFDQVAAGLALYLATKEKKEATIASSAPMLVEFNRLVGVDKVSQEVGNRNLTIRLSDYKPEDVEKVSWDIQDGQFYLTLITKPGMPSIKKEQIILSSSGVSADTVILIGGANESHFPQLSTPELSTVKLAHIGVRALTTDSGKSIMSFATSASSVSEIVANLIMQAGLNLDTDIATNLIAGIEEGSRDFKGQDVTAETFEVFAKLLRAGGKRMPKGDFARNDFPEAEVSEKTQEPQSDWPEPKIYKGTSIS